MYSYTDASEFSQFGQHNDDRGVVFPQHSPEIFGRFGQRSLRRDVRTSVPVALHRPNTKVIPILHIKSQHSFRDMINNYVTRIAKIRSSATAETVRDADVQEPTAFVYNNLTPVYNVRPLNSPACIKFTYVLVIYQYQCLRLVLACTSVPHLSSRQKCKRRLGLGGHSSV